jgi:hypothetical protein
MPQGGMVDEPVNARDKDAADQRGKSPKPSSDEKCPPAEMFPEKFRVGEYRHRKTDVDDGAEEPDDEQPSDTYQ